MFWNVLEFYGSFGGMFWNLVQILVTGGMCNDSLGAACYEIGVALLHN